VFALLAAFQSVAAQTPASNLVQNGSFEDGYPGDNICGGFWYTVGYFCDEAGTAIPGWLETGDGVDWHSVGPFPEPSAQDGNHLIDLIGGGSGKIEQAVPTTEGVLYSLSFYYARHAVCAPPGVSATVTAGASGAFVVPTATATTAADWNLASVAFTGIAGSTTTISFKSDQNFGCGGVVIDNVSVVQVLPTTADQCKKGGWQGFGVFKNQGDCVSFVATSGNNAPGGID
jgi:hypothetical protein